MYEKQKEYIKRYQGKMERVYLTMKPEEKARIQEAAAAAGMPLAAYIKKAVEAQILRDNAGRE